MVKIEKLFNDAGNGDDKYHHPRTSTKGHFSSLVAKLPAHKTDEVLRRGNMPDGIIVLNGIGYAVGQIAKNHMVMNLRGSARYTPQWMRPAIAYALVRVFGGSKFSNVQDIKLGVMFPPQDIDTFESHLVPSVVGDYEIVSNMGTHKFRVIDDVMGLDEPLGTFATAWLTEDGVPRKGSKIGDKNILVCDVGNFTTDLVPIDRGCNIDTSAMGSVVMGMGNVKDALEGYLRNTYKEPLIKAGVYSQPFPVTQIEESLQSGFYQLGKHRLDCRAFVDEQANAIAYEVLTTINNYGGAGAFNEVLMGGGGGAFLQPYLQAMAGESIDFVLAHKDTEMRYANVLGFDRFYKMLAKVE